ncbi:hypothetical protein [Enterobacter phage Phc]|nr:hypothetical protein [Enterobacter phage Phc]
MRYYLFNETKHQNRRDTMKNAINYILSTAGGVLVVGFMIWVITLASNFNGF